MHHPPLLRVLSSADSHATELGRDRGGIVLEKHQTMDPLRSRSRGVGAPGPGSPAARAVTLRTAQADLAGDLVLPAGARALVVFAHGSGSSRKSPRNRRVAERLHSGGLGTLLFDLLTSAEEAVDAVDAHLRFDIALLARRLIAATDWLVEQRQVPMPLGYFGASTGAAAALLAAAERASVIGAVVSRGGRPDLAQAALGRVRAPTLLIVGGRDAEVLALNRAAAGAIAAPCRLEVVPEATHLFEEPGALERVAELARDWFCDHLVEEPTDWL